MAEVGHDAAGPAEGAHLPCAIEGRSDDDGAVRRNAVCGGGVAAEVAEVGHDADGPAEGAHLSCAVAGISHDDRAVR